MSDHRVRTYTCSTDHTHLIVLEDNQQKQSKQHTDSFRRHSMDTSKQHTASFRRQLMDISKQHTSVLLEHCQLFKCCFLFWAIFLTMATPKKSHN
jgi:hypothetical protein